MTARRFGQKSSWLSVLIIAVMLCGMYPGAAPAGASPASGTAYYIDSTAGSDSNSGTAENSPWKTLNKVNGTVFQPGDQILLKSGGVWAEQTLAPQGSGSAGNPVIIDRYGSGDKPKIKAGGKYADALTLSNQQYWEIRNLDVSNTAPVTGSFAQSLGDYRGIHVTGVDAGTLEYFRISGVDVHDVSGEIAWISGTVPATPEPAIRFKTGWDGSKKTGGIVFDTTVADPQHPVRATVFNDVIIENSTVKNTSFGGIIFKQYTGDNGGDSSSGIASTGWGTRDSETDGKFTPHTNIIIRNNYITQNATDFGCNAMYLTDVRGALVEHNVVEGAGTSGIEMYYADDVTVQYNEVFDTSKKAGGADSNGIDPDKGTTGILIQYNYVHDNGDGILICQFSFGDTVIRYNVLESNSRYPIYLHSDKKAVAEVYNNTIYNDASGYMVYGYGTSLSATYNLRSNILYTTRAVQELTVSPTISYDNNSYYSTAGTLTPPAGDTHALTGNPQLTDPGKGTSGSEAGGPALGSLGGYQLRPESMLVNRGLGILGTNPQAVQDFAGQVLYNGNADPGAFEYYDASETTATLAGRVTNSAGNGMSGVNVSDTSGSGLQTVTDSAGYYVMKSAAVGSELNLKAVKNGYSESESGVFTVAAGNVITRDFRLSSNAATGSVTGKVLDGILAAASGVTVRLSLEGLPVQTAITGLNGSYSFPAVEVGENYTVTADKEGYRTATVSGVQVEPALAAAVSDLYVVSKQAVLVNASDFNTLATGAQPSTPWTVTVNGGSVGAAELPSAADKSIKLTRSSNSGNTSMSQTFAAGTLKGVVTLTADVLKLDNAGSTNWISLPYIYSSAGTASTNVGVSLAFAKGMITAYIGGTSTSLMPYDTDSWYNLRLVMNTGSSKYDLYINDVLVVNQAAFRNKIPDIGRIDYYANSSNYGTAYIDNVHVYRGIPYERNDAALASLTADLGPLVKQGGDYALEVPYFMDAVHLIATASSPNISSLTINSGDAASGQPSDKITLAEGSNIIPVTVTAEDGITTHTVNVIIDRTAAALDSTLQSLRVTGGGEELALSPAFSYDQDTYSLSVPASVYGLNVMPLAGAPGTEIRVNGMVVNSGGTSDEIPLRDSVSEIEVTTASQDGTDYRTYTVTVNWEGTYVPGGPAIQDSAVNPVSAVFDKNSIKSQAVAVEVEWNGNSLSAIRSGGAELKEGDYSVTGNVYGIGTAYLLQQPLGTMTLVFDFNQGKDASVAIRIIDTTEGSGGTDPGTDPGTTDSGTDPGTNPGTDPGTDPGANPGTDPGANPGTDPGMADPGNGTVPVISSGAGSSLAVQPVVTVSSGKLTANPQMVAGAAEAQVTITREALEQAFALAAADGNISKRITVTVNPQEQAVAYEISLPTTALDVAAKEQTLEIQTPDATVVLQGGMLGGGQASQGDTVVLKISAMGAAAASSLIAAANGGRPAVELSLTSGGKEVNWQDSSALVQVQIPYKLTTTELLNYEYLSVWHIDASGVSHPVTDGKYDPDSASMTFTVRHFSSYAVVMNRKSFADLGSSHWASKPVEVLAAKGIISGVSATSFAPAAPISRADYALMLIRTFGLESSGAAAAGFTDVLPGSYFYESVIAAQRLGIVSGNTDGSFAPGAPVTRQDMIVMTDRALKAAGLNSESASGSAAGTATAGIRDLDHVAQYAAESVDRMLEAGWLKGNAGLIHPEDTASRAEAAVLLYNIYSQM